MVKKEEPLIEGEEPLFEDAGALVRKGGLLIQNERLLAQNKRHMIQKGKLLDHKERHWLHGVALLIDEMEAGGPDLYIKRHGGSGSDDSGKSLLVSSGPIKEWEMSSSCVFYLTTCI